jgi:hypothetical protein
LLILDMTIVVNEPGILDRVALDCLHSVELRMAFWKRLLANGTKTSLFEGQKAILDLPPRAFPSSHLLPRKADQRDF